MHLCLSYFCCIPVGAAYFCSRAEQSKEASFALLAASQRVFQVPRKQVGPHSPGLVALCSSLFPSGSQGGGCGGCSHGAHSPWSALGQPQDPRPALPCPSSTYTAPAAQPWSSQLPSEVQSLPSGGPDLKRQKIQGLIFGVRISSFGYSIPGNTHQ